MTPAASYILNRIGAAPGGLAIVLGSGLGALAQEAENAVHFPFGALPGFPVSGVSSHRGELIIGEIAGRRVTLLAGRAHYYEHGNAQSMRQPLETLRDLGCEAVLLTNASGSLHESMGPGSLMMINDHINFSGRNPLIGVEGDGRFVNMVDAYDPALRAQILNAMKAEGLPQHQGVYLWFSGPSFETPAEIRMARTLGADAIGMSTVPETIIARYLGLRVAGISAVTNLAAGMTGQALTHAETKEEGAKLSERFIRLVRRFVADFDGGAHV